MLGSVQLALGGKMSREMIREDADYALAELTFQVEDSRIQKELEAMGIYPEDGQVWMSRRMAGKRSVNRINGETCTAAQMRAAGALLLDIHGQHEHQSLLNRKRQLDILDEYGKEKIAPIKSRQAPRFWPTRSFISSCTGADGRRTAKTGDFFPGV